MKITSKQYAISLYEAILDKKDSEIKGAIKNFVKIVIDNNDTCKSDLVISEFSKIWNRENGIIEANILSTNKLDKEIVEVLSDYIKDISKSKNVTITEKIDKKLIGGVVIKYGDKILDGSIKTRLNSLKNNMIK